jgi:hypothetical protein
MTDTAPDVRITVALDGGGPTDVTLSYPLAPEHRDLLHGMFDTGIAKGDIECRMHDDDPKLRTHRSSDGRIHGAFLYLRRNPSNHQQLVLCHWPGGPVSGSHAVPSAMTSEHRRRQEYVALRGEAAGYEVELEKSIAPGTRSDVVIRGTETMTTEVQQTGISMPTVLRRDRAAVGAGAVPTWLSDTKAPHYAFQVAHVETNEREGMNPRSWTVSTGPREIEHEKCAPASRIARCPDRRYGWCGSWHQIWVPKPGLTVDDVVEQVPAGALVRLDTGGPQGVILVSAADRDAWLEEHPEPTSTRLPQQRTNTSAMHHPNYSAEKLRKRIEAAQPQPSQGPVHSTGALCPNCRQHPAGINHNGFCTKCFFFPNRLRAPGGAV